MSKNKISKQIKKRNKKILKLQQQKNISFMRKIKKMERMMEVDNCATRNTVADMNLLRGYVCNMALYVDDGNIQDASSLSEYIARSLKVLKKQIQRDSEKMRISEGIARLGGRTLCSLFSLNTYGIFRLNALATEGEGKPTKETNPANTSTSEKESQGAVFVKSIFKEHFGIGEEHHDILAKVLKEEDDMDIDALILCSKEELAELPSNKWIVAVAKRVKEEISNPDVASTTASKNKEDIKTKAPQDITKNTENQNKNSAFEYCKKIENETDAIECVLYNLKTFPTPSSKKPTLKELSKLSGVKYSAVSKYMKLNKKTIEKEYLVAEVLNREDIQDEIATNKGKYIASRIATLSGVTVGVVTKFLGKIEKTNKIKSEISEEKNENNQAE